MIPPAGPAAPLPPGVEPFVGVQTAAAYLNLKASLVYEWVRTNRLPSYRIGRFRKFRLSELAAWVEQQRDGAATPPTS